MVFIWCRRETESNNLQKVWSLHCDSPWKQQNTQAQDDVWHQTEFGCKRISSSVDTVKAVETVMLSSPNRDLDLKDSTSIICKTFQFKMMYQVQLKKVEQFITWMTIYWNLGLLLWPGHQKQQSNLSQDIPRYDEPTKFGCKRTSTSEETAEMVIFWLHEPSLWPSQSW